MDQKGTEVETNNIKQNPPPLIPSGVFFFFFSAIHGSLIGIIVSNRHHGLHVMALVSVLADLSLRKNCFEDAGALGTAAF